MNQAQLTAVEKEILTDLLDSFERKKETTNRRTILKAEKFASYDLNVLDRKNIFIKAVKSLAERGLIDYQWRKFERENLLERIILRQDRVQDSYQALGRTRKDDRISQFLAELSGYQEQLSSAWILDFLADEADIIRSKSAWSNRWPQQIEQRREFVQLLAAIEGRQEYSMRYLSVRLYGDSKRLEKMYKNKLITVARHYIPLELDDQPILEYLGIRLNPIEILVYGELNYELDGKQLTTADYPYGTSFNRLTVEHISQLSVPTAKVLTIENKATYYEYIKRRPKGWFVIYLGGFFGKTEAEFLSKLNRSENLNFYHWSDIDLGGFQIYRYLTSILGAAVRPIAMDATTYNRYLKRYHNTEKISKSQLNQIAKQMADPEMNCLQATMQAVLTHKRRLEQECIELSDFEQILKRES